MITVGLWSLGLTLCLTGAVLLVGNLTGLAVGARLADFWGLIPLLLGVELLVAQYRAQRKAAAGEPGRIRLHAGSLAGLMILVVVAVVVNLGGGFGNGTWNWDFGTPWHWNLNYGQEAAVSLSQGQAIDQSVTTVSIDVPPGGDWTIMGVDGDQVAVQAEVTAQAGTSALAGKAALGAKLVFVTEGNRLRLWLEAPGYEPGSPSTAVRLSATGTVTLPGTLALEFDSSTAAVSVSDLAGRVNLDTATGDIVVRNVGGSLSAHSSTGGILAEDIAGDADASSSTGSVELARIGGAVKASTATGRIRVTEPGTGVDVDTSTGECTVSSAKPVAGNWSLETSTGSVEVDFPQDSDVNVRVRTGLGSISSNLGFPISSSIAQKTMEGTLGKGTYEITIGTNTGSVTVNGVE